MRTVKQTITGRDKKLMKSHKILFGATTDLDSSTMVVYLPIAKAEVPSCASELITRGTTCVSFHETYCLGDSISSDPRPLFKPIILFYFLQTTTSNKYKVQ